jgi:WD40 repeat protein
MEFHPDSRTLLAGNGNGVVQWDVETGQKVSATPLDGGTLALALSPDGRTLATYSSRTDQRGNSEGDVRLWRVDRPT